MGRTYKYTHNTKEENETKEKESERERICIKQSWKLMIWWMDVREWNEKRKYKQAQADSFSFFIKKWDGEWHFILIHSPCGKRRLWTLVHEFSIFFNKPSANVIGRSLKIAQITFFAFVPTSRRGWSENIVVLDQHGDDRVWNVGGYAVHIASLPPLATIVQYLCHFKLPLCYDFIKQKNKSWQRKKRAFKV